MKREIETNAEDISSIANRYKTGNQKLRRAYKENISDYNQFNKKYRSMFEEEAFVFPENIGPNMGIDETGLKNGELYTIFYNKDGKGKKGSLAAIIKGVKTSTVAGAIEKYADVSCFHAPEAYFLSSPINGQSNRRKEPKYCFRSFP